MAAIGFRFAITPKAAVAKFLGDMRPHAERAWRQFGRVLADVLSDCALTRAERRALLDLHPAEDFFYAALVALHGYRIRELFAPPTAEALLRELALQVDAAAGRTDSTVSTMVFIALGRIRKARQRGSRCDHDPAVETLLERIGLRRDARTQPVMTSLAMRHALAEPLALAAPNWWQSFAGIYRVRTATPSRRPPRRMLPRRFVDARITALPCFSLRASTPAPFSFTAWLSARGRPPIDHG